MLYRAHVRRCLMDVYIDEHVLGHTLSRHEPGDWNVGLPRVVHRFAHVGKYLPAHAERLLPGMLVVFAYLLCSLRRISTRLNRRPRCREN